jgi:hypothetical protein
MNFPSHCEVVDCGRYTVVFTSVSLDKKEGTFKLFQTFGDAVKWVHDESEKQFPDWHKKNCPLCIPK